MVVREVCKGSWLQQKLRTTSKPLKKADCLPEQWMVFCVHDDRVPLLEIYPNEREVEGHRPLKLIDLFHCSYLCKSIDDDRSFVIGFKSESGRNVLEFAALTETERDEWVSILTFKLQQTGHLEVNSNIYSPLPSLDISQPPLPDLPRLSNPRHTLVDLSPSSANRVYNDYTGPPEEQHYELLNSNSGDLHAPGNVYETPRRSGSTTSGGGELPVQIFNGNDQSDTPLYEHIACGLSLNESQEEEEANGAPSSPTVPLAEPSQPSYSTVSSSNARKSNVKDRTSHLPPPIPPRKRSTSEMSPHATDKFHASMGVYDVLTPSLASASPAEQTRFQFSLPQYDQLPPEGTATSEEAASNKSSASSGNPTVSATVKSPRSLEIVVPPPMPSERSYQRYADPTNTPVTVQDIERRARVSSQRSSTVTTTRKISLNRSVSSENPPDIPTTPVPAPPLPPRNSSTRGSAVVREAISGYSMPQSGEPGSGIRRKLTLKEEEVSRLQREMTTQCGIKLTLPVQDALAGLALVETGGRLWVAGWAQKCHKRLSVGFHVGDQILSLNGRPVTTLKQVELILKSSIAQLSNVTYVVRRLPFAQVFIMKRSENYEDLGIIRKEGKAEIVEVRRGSIACQAGLEKDGPSFHNTAVRVPWILTEVNSRHLSIFAKGEEISARLNAVGKDISLLVQPKDFVSDLKTQLKMKKNWKDFVVG